MEDVERRIEEELARVEAEYKDRLIAELEERVLELEQSLGER